MGKNTEEKNETSYLIDFLYRDNEIINSLYAQIFSGNIVSLQKVQTTNDETATTIGTDTKLFQASQQNKSSSTNSINENIEPHDAKIIELFDNLSIPLHIDSLNECTDGQLIMVKGQIKIRNMEIIQKSLPLLKSLGIDEQFNFLIPTMSNNSKNKKQKVNFHDIVKQFLSLLPSGLEMELETVHNEKILAFIKEEYLSYRSYDILRIWGNNIPGQWSVIGIINKNIKNNHDSINDNSESIRNLVDVIHESVTNLINQDSPQFTIIPIIIYREIVY